MTVPIWYLLEPLVADGRFTVFDADAVLQVWRKHLVGKADDYQRTQHPLKYVFAGYTEPDWREQLWQATVTTHLDAQHGAMAGYVLMNAPPRGIPPLHAAIQAYQRMRELTQPVLVFGERYDVVARPRTAGSAPCGVGEPGELLTGPAAASRADRGHHDRHGS